MFFGFTYSNFVKEFGVNAFIQQLNLESDILSNVSGVPITIVIATIVNAINCENDGVLLDIHLWEYYFLFDRIFVDPSKTSDVSNLHSKATVWHQLLNTNFLPRNEDLDSLDIKEKDLMLLLTSDIQISHP